MSSKISKIAIIGKVKTTSIKNPLTKMMLIQTFLFKK